ncbi:MAG: hypothetical protein HQL15_00120 [Candidatus Omnitrophica bacterium]|nr:hypothetical protein [Candidatus Omnitrophota bacterium]
MRKDIILVVLVLACIGLIILLVSLFEKTNKVTKSLDEERYSRMVAEESLQRNAAKLSTLEAQLKSANQKMAKVQDQIDQEKSTNGDLQKQYEELFNVKADLEAKLKIALEEKPAPVTPAAPTQEPPLEKVNK